MNFLKFVAAIAVAIISTVGFASGLVGGAFRIGYQAGDALVDVFTDKRVAEYRARRRRG